MTAKKQDAKKPEVQPQPQPTPATPTVEVKTQSAQPQPASKQSQTIVKLKEAWTAKGISLKELTEKQDGKFTLLQPTPEWPIVRVGPTGGVELPQIRSYAKAWDAAVDGLAVWQKQQQRDKKKAATATSSAPPAQAAKPQSTSASKPETPTAKKARKDAAIEAQLA